MTTPELRPGGANGTANGAVAIVGVESDRIRNLALDLLRKTAKVDRTTARIAKAASTILEEIKPLTALPARSGAVERERIMEAMSLWSSAADALAANDVEAAASKLWLLEKIGHDVESSPALKVSRGAARALLHGAIGMRFSIRDSLDTLADIPGDMASLLDDALAR